MDLTPFLVAGKGRDSLDGFHPQFRDSLAAMFAAAPPDIQPHLRIASGYRSNERQAQLWQDALKKYGSPDAARKWVAPPGRSNHNHGNAADLKYLAPAALQWAHANAGKYGLAFPLSNENWHIEPAGLRGGAKQMPVMAQGATPQQTAPTTLASNFAPDPEQAGMADILAGLGSVSAPVAAPQQDAQAVAQAKKIRQQALFDNANLWG